MVITGGASQLHGMREVVATARLGLPVRLLVCRSSFNGLPESGAGVVVFAAVAGLLVCCLRTLHHAFEMPHEANWP